MLALQVRVSPPPPRTIFSGILDVTQRRNRVESQLTRDRPGPSSARLVSIWELEKMTLRRDTCGLFRGAPLLQAWQDTSADGGWPGGLLRTDRGVRCIVLLALFLPSALRLRCLPGVRDSGGLIRAGMPVRYDVGSASSTTIRAGANTKNSRTPISLTVRRRVLAERLDRQPKLGVLLQHLPGFSRPSGVGQVDPETPEGVIGLAAGLGAPRLRVDSKGMSRPHSRVYLLWYIWRRVYSCRPSSCPQPLPRVDPTAR